MSEPQDPQLSPETRQPIHLVQLARAIALENEVLIEGGVSADLLQLSNLEALVLASRFSAGRLAAAREMLDEEAECSARRILMGAEILSAFYGDE